MSIVIPTFNHARFVLDTLQSVFTQSWTDCEVIVINDGSSDETAQVLKPLVEAGKIRYVEQANAGQAAARNRGLALARGELIAFLDDDDLWPSDRLRAQVAILGDNPSAVMVYGSYERFGDVGAGGNAEGRPVAGAVVDFVAFNPIVSPGQTLMRAGTLRKLGGFDSSLSGTDDWDLYLRLAAAGEIIYQDLLALRYRVHQANASKRYWRMYQNGMKVVEKHFGGDPALRGKRRRARRFIQQYTSQMGVTHSLDLFGQRRWFAALAAILTTVWIQPGRASPLKIGRRVHLILKTIFAGRGESQSVG